MSNKTADDVSPFAKIEEEVKLSGVIKPVRLNDMVEESKRQKTKPITKIKLTVPKLPSSKVVACHAL